MGGSTPRPIRSTSISIYATNMVAAHRRDPVHVSQIEASSPVKIEGTAGRAYRFLGDTFLHVSPSRDPILPRPFFPKDGVLKRPLHWLAAGEPEKEMSCRRDQCGGVCALWAVGGTRGD